MLQQTIYTNSSQKSGEKPRFSSNGQDIEMIVTKQDEILVKKTIQDPKLAGEMEIKVHDHQAKRLDEAVNGTSRVLFQAKAVFPWDFFPDELVVDENKVSFIFNTLPWTKTVRSIMIKDISDLIVNTSVFFASLRVVDIGFKENLIDIDYLWVSDALRARRIIQGLVVAYKREIDTSHVPLPELAAKIEELGKVDN